MDFTIYDIIRFYRRNGRILLGIILAIFMLATSYFVMSTKQYQASLDILPADNRQDGLSGAGAGGSIAQALIGGSSTNPDFANFTSSFGSIQLAERLLADATIAQTIFAGRWDAEQKRWVLKSGWTPMALLDRALRFVFDMKASDAPTPFEMRDYVLARVNLSRSADALSKSSDSRATRLTFRHPDPVFARTFLSRVVREQDDILRRQKLSVYEKENMALRERFGIEPNRNVQEYMIRWISENENKIVKTESAEYFAFQILDPVSVTTEPVKPQPLFSVILSLIAAVVGGVFILAVFGFVRLVTRNSAAP